MTLEQKLEKHFAVHGAKPEFKAVIEGQEVFFADGGIHRDDPTQPEGYYVTAFAIKRGEAIGVQPVYFSALHNLELTDSARKAARLNAVVKQAKQHIRDGKQAGHYG